MLNLKNLGSVLLFGMAACCVFEARAFGHLVERIDSDIDSSNVLATVIDPSCRQQTRDSFDLGWRFTENSRKYAGQCVESRMKRPIKILKDTAEEMEFANVLHRGRYWIAHWNKNKNRPRVQYLAVHFDSGVPLVTAGHTELHFIFPKAIELVSQTTGEKASLQNLVLAWEANMPPKTSFNIVFGLVPDDAIAGRVISLESRIPENILPDGSLRRTEIYNLHLSDAEGAAILHESLRTSDRLGYSRFYRTLGPNCTSELFDVVDEVLRVTKKGRMASVMPFQTLPVPDPIIGPGHAALIERGLIDAGATPGDLGSCLHGKFDQAFYQCVSAAK